MPEKYDELKDAVQRLVHSGKLTPDLRAVLVEHGVISIPSISPDMSVRVDRALLALKEPMRDDELGRRARNELPIIGEALLDSLPVVRQAVKWRYQISSRNLAIPPEAQELAAEVDSFLSKVSR